MNTRIYLEHEDHATLEDEEGAVLDAVTFASAPLKHSDPEDQRAFACGWAVEQLVSDAPMRVALNTTYAVRGLVS